MLHAGDVPRCGAGRCKGIGGGATYTLARSRDNASIDRRRRHRRRAGRSEPRRRVGPFELRSAAPAVGRRQRRAAVRPEPPWLNNGGFWAALLENWRVHGDVHLAVGHAATRRASPAPRPTSPAAPTARCARNYNGEPIAGLAIRRSICSSTPPPSRSRRPGTFGNASRNMIIGPGSRLLNAQFSRDLRLGGTRALTLQVNASNLLNMVNYAAIDTVVNSPTFGQVLSVRPMRSMQAQPAVPVLRRRVTTNFRPIRHSTPDAKSAKAALGRAVASSVGVPGRWLGSRPLSLRPLPRPPAQRAAAPGVPQRAANSSRSTSSCATGPATSCAG